MKLIEIYENLFGYTVKWGVNSFFTDKDEKCFYYIKALILKQDEEPMIFVSERGEYIIYSVIIPDENYRRIVALLELLREVYSAYEFILIEVKKHIINLVKDIVEGEKDISILDEYAKNKEKIKELLKRLYDLYRYAIIDTPELEKGIALVMALKLKEAQQIVEDKLVKITINAL